MYGAGTRCLIALAAVAVVGTSTPTDAEMSRPAVPDGTYVPSTPTKPTYRRTFAPPASRAPLRSWAGDSEAFSRVVADARERLAVARPRPQRSAGRGRCECSAVRRLRRRARDVGAVRHRRPGHLGVGGGRRAHDGDRREGDQAARTCAVHALMSGQIRYRTETPEVSMGYARRA